MTTMQTILAKFDHAKRSREEAVRAFAELAPRQYEVVLLFAKGYDSGEIGRLLNIQKTTVQASKYRSFQILGVTSNAEVAVMAYKAGLLGE